MNHAPIFKGASGGKSDSIFTGIADSFQESSNIEIREDSQSIKLTKKLIKDSGTVIVEPINCFIKASTGDIFAYGNSGGVYHKTGGTWYKNTSSITGAILSAIEYDGYMYLTNSTNLYRVALVSFGHAMTFIAYQTFTKSSYYHPMVILENTLYIGDEYYVTYLDALGDWVGNFLEINNDTTIKYIKKQGNNIKIYAEDIYGNSQVIYWDSINTATIETVPLNGVKIGQFIEKDGYDYMLANNKIGIRDGYKLQILKENITASTNLNSILIKDDRIMYGGTGVLWEWGSLNKNYPSVLSNSYTTSNDITDTVNAIFYTGDDLYASWSNGVTHGVDKLSSTTYNPSGYLITRVYYGGIKSIRKYSNNVLTAFNKIAGTDTIKIYYRTQITGSYVLYDTLTATSVKTNDYCNMLQLDSEFNFIEFKIELNGGTTTPEFYELFLELNNLA